MPAMNETHRAGIARPVSCINLHGVTQMPTVVIAIARPKFPLGQIVISANAQAKLDPADVQQGLKRHASGDWGEVCSEDALLNDDSVEYGDRLLSVYRSGDTRFWIITEWDRSVTTVLLPEDY
jgi:hypothetical protein